MFNRIDKWFGRYMNRTRWITIYVLIIAGGARLLFMGWWAILGALLILLGGLGFFGNMSRHP